MVVVFDGDYDVVVAVDAAFKLATITKCKRGNRKFLLPMILKTKIYIV